jgi:cell shape-determining protein MreD
MVLYICFIEFGSRNNILSLSIVTGLIADIFYSPIIGISLFIFFLIYIALIIYKNYVDFEKFYIRIIFYMAIIMIYINYNLVLYDYPLDAFLVFNIKRLSLDVLIVLLVFTLVKRIQRAF